MARRSRQHRDRFRRADKSARAAAAWVGHALVRELIPPCRPAFRRLFEPLRTDLELGTITLMVARWLDATGRYPDGTEWPNPFANYPADRLPVVRTVGGAVVEALRRVAGALAAHGVPLDPDWHGNWLLLAQLLACDVDLARPADAILAELNIVPPGVLVRGQRATTSSRHATVQFGHLLTDIAFDLADEAGSPHIRAPYAAARGGHRAQHTQERRRAALRELQRQMPRSCTVEQILRSWSQSAHTPGGWLRERLAAEGVTHRPSATTLYRDLRAIGAAP